YREHSSLAVSQAMAAAQKAALDIAARQPHATSQALILASEGLIDLSPEEVASAWTLAIADYLGRLDDDRDSQLAAIQKAIASMKSGKRSKPAA
ncbi:MAG: hypothetical protein ACIAQU_11680, partial [Phycisphaerales bacterium JB064]